MTAPISLSNWIQLFKRPGALLFHDRLFLRRKILPIEVDVYFREPKDLGSGQLLGRIFLKKLPMLNESFDTSLLGPAAPKFPVKVGAIGHGTPRAKVKLIPESNNFG